MPAPAFSVVIPAYNGAATIRETIDSVLQQSESDLELVVVDDGSSDETPRVVAAAAADDQRVTLIQQSNEGVAGARNSGIENTRAEYVAFVDNDDLWMPDYLASMGAALDRAPSAGFAYTDAYLLDDRYCRINRRTSLEFHDPIPQDLGSEDMLTRLLTRNFIMSSVMCRRAALEETGGYSRLVNGVDDWDLWLRIVSRGWTVVKGEVCVLIQRDRADSQSKDELMMWSRSETVLLRLLADESLPESVRALAKSRMAEIRFRIRREVSHGPRMTAIRARRRWLGFWDQANPSKNWLTESPPDVALAFPNLAERYGRASASAA